MPRKNIWTKVKIWTFGSSLVHLNFENSKMWLAHILFKGEYVLMVTDVTSPPFMGQTLDPAYLLLKMKRPKREKKPKENKPK